MRLLIVFLLASLILSSCQNTVQEECVYAPDTKGITIDLQYEALEEQLPVIKTKQDLVDFFSRNVTMRDYFFNRPAYPSDSVFINELFSRFSNPHLDTLLMETKTVFGDGAQLKEELAMAFTNLKSYYPDFQVPRVQTVITGLESARPFTLGKTAYKRRVLSKRFFPFKKLKPNTKTKIATTARIPTLVSLLIFMNVYL